MKHEDFTIVKNIYYHPDLVSIKKVQNKSVKPEDIKHLLKYADKPMP